MMLSTGRMLRKKLLKGVGIWRSPLATTRGRYTFKRGHRQITGDSIIAGTAIENENECLFRLTRGRFVVNESHEEAMRYQHFEPQELANVASEVTGGIPCVKLVKHADGLYNKVFLLTMRNGQEVIAKIPHRNAGLPHLTTASEVATMTFVRNVRASQETHVLTEIGSRRSEHTHTQSTCLVLEGRGELCGIRVHHYGEGAWRSSRLRLP